MLLNLLFSFISFTLKLVAFPLRVIFGGEKKERTILTEIKDGVGRITMNRPKKKNAINQQMYKEFEAALRMMSGNIDVKVVVITGSGDFYTAGNDLSNFSQFMHPLDMARKAKNILQSFVASFIACPKPIIAAVNGPSIGIGVTTLGLCDRVFSADTAYFKAPFVELGQAPEACSTFTFPRIVGQVEADEILLKGKKISAFEASKIGLVHHICKSENLDNDVMVYCKRLASKRAGDPELVREIVRDGIVETLHAVNETECLIMERHWVSKKCFTALAAFLDSRNMKAAALLLRYFSSLK